MHKFLINASIQVVPLAQDRHPYEWVDIAIPIIQSAGLKYEVRAFSTEIEGKYDEIMAVFNQINTHLQKQGCAEWIINLQIQIRANEDMTGDEKMNKYKQV